MCYHVSCTVVLRAVVLVDVVGASTSRRIMLHSPTSDPLDLTN